jgi:hypothetical protein
MNDGKVFKQATHLEKGSRELVCDCGYSTTVSISRLSAHEYVWVDNGDGTATWTLKYSFTSEGTQEWAVQIRNNTWSAIDEKSTFEITAK